MHRRCSTVLVIFVLAVAAVPVATAQSGRGRQLRIQERSIRDSTTPTAPDVQEDRKIDPGFSRVSPGGTRRNSPLIYHEDMTKQGKNDGDYRMTRGDKIVGVILLGLLVVAVIGIARE